MTTIQDLPGKLRTVRDSLIEDRPREALIIALDLNALVKIRIQRSGENAEGRPFSPYSQLYAKRRQNKGLQTNYVDFTDTGRMWANIRPQIVGNTLATTVIDTKAGNAGDQAKLDGQFKKRGNILIPNDKEQKTAEDANTARIARKLAQI